MSMRRFSAVVASLGVAGALAAYGSAVVANDITDAGDRPASASGELSPADRAGARPRTPMLTDPSQLPQEVRDTLGIGTGIVPQGFGTANHPFTTKRATTKTGALTTIKQFPYSGSGKLWMQFGADTYVCSASVIEKGVLVTAAHCVWDYGIGPADSVWFEPARHIGTTPYGVWTAVTWAVPGVYAGGTDVCTVPGIVCENDLAVVVLNTNGAGQYIKEVVKGEYNWDDDGYGYTGFKGAQSAQITEMGYPVAFDGGYQMIRTDSLGYWAEPSNVIIGTDQTGGSSGGPWIVNFGKSPVSTSSVPSENKENTVMATTSWGYVDSTVKIQGASRFAKNTTFTVTSNIEALKNWACSSYPSHCD